MRKPRVIIFDDEPSLLELLELCFAKWGYEVFSYSTPVVCPLNGSSAGICESHAPCADLVISDFQMPQMTGIELFQLQAQRGCRPYGLAQRVRKKYRLVKAIGWKITKQTP